MHTGESAVTMVIWPISRSLLYQLSRNGLSCILQGATEVKLSSILSNPSTFSQTPFHKSGLKTPCVRKLLSLSMAKVY